MGKPSQIVRLVEILRRIPVLPRRTDIPELTQKLQAAGFEGMTIRVVGDDVRVLDREFIEIDRDDEGLPHRYGWKGKSHPVLGVGMEPVDATLLALAEPMLRAMAAGAVGARLEQMLKQARDMVKSGGKLDFLARVRGLPEALPRERPRVRAGVLERIVEGLAGGVSLEALYKARNRPKAARYELEPLALVSVGPATMLIAHKVGGDVAQHFELQRFHSVAVGTELEEVTAFDLEAHIEAGELAWPIGPDGFEIELELSEKYRDEVLDAPLSPGQVVEGDVVRAWVRDTHALQRFVLGMGKEVVVRGPGAYVERMAAEVAGMAQAYELSTATSKEGLELVQRVLVPASARGPVAAELLAEITWQVMGWAKRAGGRVLGPGYRYEGAESPPDLAVYAPGRSVQGTPDVAIDLLDGPARARTRVRKGGCYAEQGVAERWLVDPEAGTAERLVLQGKGWVVAQALEGGGRLESSVLAGLTLDLTNI